MDITNEAVRKRKGYVWSIGDIELAQPIKTDTLIEIAIVGFLTLVVTYKAGGNIVWLIGAPVTVCAIVVTTEMVICDKFGIDSLFDFFTLKFDEKTRNTKTKGARTVRRTVITYVDEQQNSEVKN